MTASATIRWPLEHVSVDRPGEVREARQSGHATSSANPQSRAHSLRVWTAAPVLANLYMHYA
jgi:hypothetical protein